MKSFEKLGSVIVGGGIVAGAVVGRLVEERLFGTEVVSSKDQWMAAYLGAIGGFAISCVPFFRMQQHAMNAQEHTQPPDETMDGIAA